MVVTLQALDPIYLDFFVPQQARRSGAAAQSLDVKVDAYPERRVHGRDLGDQSAGRLRQPQRPGAGDPARTPIIGCCPACTRPSTSRSASRERYITLPQTAITYNPYGDSVYVVDDKGNGADGKPQLVARQTFVTTGATRGDQVAVLTGVKEGETVVVGRPDQAAQRLHGARSTTRSCRPPMRRRMPVDR